MNIMLEHQNKIKQRNLPSFDQPRNDEDFIYRVGSQRRRNSEKACILTSDSKQHFGLLKENIVQNHCLFKKQPMNVVL